jgi:hypothetical protein
MLHLGHFSFDELDYKQNYRHGYFACIVDAIDEDDAVKKFKAHIMDMKQENMAFSTIVKVYIEDIIQVASIPEKPIVTRLQSSAGEFPKSISYTLPSLDVDGIDAFGLKTNVQKLEAEESGDYMESVPFITF